MIVRNTILTTLMKVRCWSRELRIWFSQPTINKLFLTIQSGYCIIKRNLISGRKLSISLFAFNLFLLLRPRGIQSRVQLLKNSGRSGGLSVSQWPSSSMSCNDPRRESPRESEQSSSDPRTVTCTNTSCAMLREQHWANLVGIPCFGCKAPIEN